MQKKMRLTGIITQGASRMGVAEFIKAFKVASSFDGKIYTVHRADGQRKDKVTSQAHALRTQGNTWPSHDQTCDHHKFTRGHTFYSVSFLGVGG